MRPLLCPLISLFVLSTALFTTSNVPKGAHWSCGMEEGANPTLQQRTYSKIANCAYRLHGLVASMYLGVVLCVTSVQGDCLQIQATIQVDSGDDVSIRGRATQWYKILVSVTFQHGECVHAWSMVKRPIISGQATTRFALFFLCLLKGSVANAINSFRLLAARLSATHTPAHTPPPSLLHFVPLSPLPQNVHITPFYPYLLSSNIPFIPNNQHSQH